MNCPHCGTRTSDTARFCSHCGSSLLLVSAKPHCGRLPHPLALVLQEYHAESNDYIKLHRLCDAAEMLTRFLTTVALAELSASAHSPAWPPGLRAALLDGIERPTFGNWIGILREAGKALSSWRPQVVPELPALAEDLFAIVCPDKATRETALLPLRNSLVHDARFTAEQAHAFLDEHGHRKRFEALWSKPSAGFLTEVELLGIPSAGTCLLLRGIPDRAQGFAPAAASPPDWPAGTILLCRPPRQHYLNLFPLHAFGPVLRRLEGALQERTTEGPVALIYARTDRRVQYTALHPREGHGDGSDAMQAAFDALFPLRDWRLARLQAEEMRLADAALRAAAREYSFRDVVEPLLREPFVGRAAQVTAALVWLDRQRSGAGLVLGQPGMGKTAFAAHLSAEIKRHNRDWLCLRHFFKVADSRCSTRRFVTGVLLQLQLAAGGGRVELPPADKEAIAVFVDALASFSRDRLGPGRTPSRLVLLVDGLDEIAQMDRHFFELVVRAGRIDNIVWLCLGRPEPAVLDGLPAEWAERLFPDLVHPEQTGLPPLDRRAVREFLVEELGRRRYTLLGEESDEGRSRFLDVLTDEARCLPLYLHLLVEDMRRGEFDVHCPDKPPCSLEDYYQRLTDQLALDAARKVLPDVVSLLAVARTPLTDGMLATLLADHDLRGDREWQILFHRSLHLGHSVLKTAYLWDDRTGQTLYHGSFRDHLLQGEAKSYEEFRLAPVLRRARQRVLDLCRRWKEWPAGSDEQRYALAHAMHHLMEVQDTAAVAALVRDGFFQAKAAALGDVEAFVEARQAAELLAQAGSEGCSMLPRPFGRGKFRPSRPARRSSRRPTRSSSAGCCRCGPFPAVSGSSSPSRWRGCWCVRRCW
jgi:hypothetical protein